MRLPRLATLLLAATMAVPAVGGLGGCVVRGRGAVVVHDAPPPPRRARVRDHRAGYVWVEGHWVRRHHRWVWSEGHYVRERRGYHHRPGRWARRDGGWVWIQATWVRR
jgi:hypothetical protein